MAHHIIPKDPATPDNKTAYDLMTILPHSAEVIGGHLWIGGMDTVELAHETGTAVYVMDEDHLRARLRDYHDWFTRLDPSSEVIYAGKAFCCKAMLRLVAEEQCCLDVSSGGELAFAQAAGFPLANVYVHGNNKTEDELRECLAAHVGHIVVDSFEELERLSRLAVEAHATQPVLIRVTPGIEADTHDFIKTGAEDSKFGFGLNQGLALEAVKRTLSLPGLDFEGVHMHIGSQIFALHSFKAAIDVMVDFIEQIHHETGAAVRILDTGGGLGVAYGVADEPSTIEEYAEVITGGIRADCEARSLSVPRIAVEPGRSIVANAGVTLYTVGTIKE
ncbi:MAG: alanine racemase, partial [Coriobacteriia bacterium]|nr:alanine racemase [Coriobacteriia bacterium]